MPGPRTARRCVIMSMMCFAKSGFARCVAGEKTPVRAVFIRAPWVEEVGPGVEVLAEVDGRPVLAREGRFLVAAFHPELTDDTRLHQRFLDLVEEASRGLLDVVKGRL